MPDMQDSESSNGVYLDNAAAMPPDPETLKRLNDRFAQDYANQESAGYHGVTARGIMQKAETVLKRAFSQNCDEKYSVLWCCSGTEAIQASVRLISLVRPNGGVILYTAGEHSSVKAALHSLPEKFSCMEVKLERDGSLDFEDFIQKLSPDAVAFVFHFVQSETGRIQDLIRVRKVLADHRSPVLFLTDSIQGVGKIPFPCDYAAPDIFTVSGSKIGVPCGACVLCRNEWTKQLLSLRSVLHSVGRLPVPYALTLADKVTDLISGIEERRKHFQGLKNILFSELNKFIPNMFRITISNEMTSEYICHILLTSADGKNSYQGAIIARALSAKKISVSSGSACDSETDTPSPVLSAMGFSRREAFSALRISFGYHTTESDIRIFSEALHDVLTSY